MNEYKRRLKGAYDNVKPLPPSYFDTKHFQYYVGEEEPEYKIGVVIKNKTRLQSFLLPMSEYIHLHLMMRICSVQRHMFKNAPAPYDISEKKCISEIEDKINLPIKLEVEPLRLPKYDINTIRNI